MSHPEYSSSTTEIAANLLERCNEALNATISDEQRASAVAELGTLYVYLEEFVRGYETIDDPAIDTDDEILNWVFTETQTDFSSALWLLASGFYKASASSLRNAFDIATAALYFQIRENTHPQSGGYNRLFAEWDQGVRDTPNWGEMKPFIAQQPAVSKFEGDSGIDIVAVAYDHFKDLCAYTHTAAFTKAGEPVTAINMTGTAPAFENSYFERGVELYRTTASMIAILWKVTFPQMPNPPQLAAAAGQHPLFPSPAGPPALNHSI